MGLVSVVENIALDESIPNPLVTTLKKHNTLGIIKKDPTALNPCTGTQFKLFFFFFGNFHVVLK